MPVSDGRSDSYTAACGIVGQQHAVGVGCEAAVVGHSIIASLERETVNRTPAHGDAVIGEECIGVGRAVALVGVVLMHVLTLDGQTSVAPTCRQIVEVARTPAGRIDITPAENFHGPGVASARAAYARVLCHPV